MSVTELHPYTLGGSDAGAVCGVDEHRTPLDVYLRLTDPRFAVERNEAMEWGIALQDDIAEAVERRGYTVMPFSVGGVRDETRPWLHGHPDAITVLEDEYAVLECKTAGYWAHREWNGGVPLVYECQVQLYMHLLGWPRALVAVLVGGQRLELQTIARSERAIGLILARLDEFHLRLVAGVPPDPLPADKENLYALYANAEKGSVGRYTAEQMDLVYDLRLIREAEAKIKTQRAELERLLQLAHGDNETMRAPNDYDVSRWTPTTRTTFDTQRFKRDHPGLYAEYSTTTQLRRFQLL